MAEQQTNLAPAKWRKRIVVALCGASGTPYAKSLLAALARAGMDIHVTISDGFFKVVAAEEPDSRQHLCENVVDLEAWTGEPGSYHYYHHKQIGAPIASGSYRTIGMVVAPCSTSTLGNIANGTGKTLVERAADVVLKEGRKLVIMLRESPLSAIALENALKLARLGVVIVPTSPGFYARPQTVQDMVDFSVARVLDQFEIDHDLSRRWGEA